MSNDELSETHDVTVRYDPDEVSADDIEDYFHEMVHAVDHTDIVFTNTERFDHR